MPLNFYFGNLLPTTATIQQRTVTKDEGGGVTNSWSTRFANVPVVIQPLSGAMAETYAKLQMEVDSVAYTSTVLAVQNGDRLTSDGINYQIQFTEDQGGMGLVFSMALKRITD